MTDSSPLVLHTDRLILHLPGPEAASRMVHYYESNRAHLTPWEPPFPRGMFTNSFWQHRLSQNQQEYVGGQSMRLVLRRRTEPHGPIVGLANFTQFVRGAFMACTLGYSMDEDSQGQGLMAEALRRALAHVFGDLGMHRVMANYMPINERSGRLLKKLGFNVEGYARDYLYINGSWRDHILTSLVNDRASVPEYLATGRARG
ncbi:MAG: GNAT family N-acetyltransferase [Deltaproteobacteria bacterium]|nr:GNAT family N-acetyltransferase [Deltaproteobacteria bacterium]